MHYPGSRDLSTPELQYRDTAWAAPGIEHDLDHMDNLDPNLLL